MNLRIAPTETCFCKLSRPCKNSRCFQKMVQLFNFIELNHVARIINKHFAEKNRQKTIKLYSNQRLLEIRVCKAVLLNEEILRHCQNSRFLRTYANSNKMSGPLLVQINGFYTIFISFSLIILPSCCFPFKSFLRSSKLINKTKECMVN